MTTVIRVIFCAISLALAVTAAGQERRPGSPGDETGRDAVGFRKDRVTNETVGERRDRANTPTTKQAVEDFLELQKINQQIQQMTKAEPLELEKIAAAAKQISGRAARLRTSLSLPIPPNENNKTGLVVSSSTDQLLEHIKELDASIKAFVTNPIFRQMNDSTKNLPMEASVHLRKVIALSKLLEEGAKRLRQ